VNADQPLAPAGGRRFVLTVGASGLYTLLLVAGLITEDGYITLQMMTVGAFMAANSVQKWADAHRAEK
jgi:hypothetical protein